MTEVQSYFEKASANYSARSKAWPWRWLRGHELSVVREVLARCRYQSVLELGCGTGFYTRELAREGARLTCVDFSQGMLQGLSVPGTERICADIESFVCNRKFDLIFCAGALEFTGDPARVLSNAAEMLAEGGNVVLLVPINNPWVRFYQAFHRRHAVPVRAFALDEMREWTRPLRLAWAKKVFPFSCVIQLSRE